MSSQIDSPDRSAKGFWKSVLDPFRYDGHSEDPNEVAGVLKSLMPENARVLDVGCGTGSVTIIANTGKQNHVYCVEPDVRRSQRAQARGLKVHIGHVEDAEVSEQAPFDVIMMADVLEHVAAPDLMLARIKELMQPEGLVLASVPNAAHWSLRMKLLKGRFDYEASGLCDATHLRWFTTYSAIELFEASGFEVQSVRYTAGKTLRVYSNPAFTYIPSRLLGALINRCAAALPKLFACQIVISARL